MSFCSVDITSGQLIDIYGAYSPVNAARRPWFYFAASTNRLSASSKLITFQIAFRYCPGWSDSQHLYSKRGGK